MSFFSRLFGNGAEDQPQPHIQFGRYTDSYKTTAQYDAWDAALQKFEDEEYLDSYRNFLKYLRDEKEDNVTWRENDGRIEFDFFQGSKKISGTADKKNFKVIAKIAQTKSLNIGFMRRLVEQNFDLRHTRYALDPNDEIVIIFGSPTIDSSPYKLYQALKELATKADKQDDLLLDEFTDLKALSNHHISPISKEEMEAKYEFICKKINSVFEIMDNGRLSPGQYTGAMAYLMLDLGYRLDYLVSAEGHMTDLLERVHRKYFENDGKPTAQKNQYMRKEFQKLLDRPKEDYFKEMYKVKSTFGITVPVNLDKIVDFTEGEIGNMDWYTDNRHQEVAMAIPGYIIGYCLFNYAVPKPIREVFELYYQITEPAFFTKLGFTNSYRQTSRKLDKRAINRAFNRIEDANEKTYSHLNFDVKKINFSTDPAFAKSFLLMIRGLDLRKN